MNFQQQQQPGWIWDRSQGGFVSVSPGQGYIPVSYSMGPASSRAFMKQTEVRPPFVDEVVHKQQIQQITPVVTKEVIIPQVTEVIQPIYEKVVEAPVVQQQPQFQPGQQQAFAAPSQGSRSVSLPSVPSAGVSQPQLPSQSQLEQKQPSLAPLSSGTGLQQDWKSKTSQLEAELQKERANRSVEVQSLTQQLEQLKKEKAASPNAANLNKQIQELSNLVQSKQQEINRLSSELKEWKSRIHTLSALQHKLEKKTTKHKQLKQNMLQLQQKLEEIQYSKNEALENQGAKWQAQLQHEREKAELALKGNQKLASQLHGWQEREQTLQAQISVLQSRENALNETISSLRREVEAVKYQGTIQMHELQQKNQNLNAALQRAQSVQEELQREIAEFEIERNSILKTNKANILRQEVIWNELSKEQQRELELQEQLEQMKKQNVELATQLRTSSGQLREFQETRSNWEQELANFKSVHSQQIQTLEAQIISLTQQTASLQQKNKELLEENLKLAEELRFGKESMPQVQRLQEELRAEGENVKAMEKLMEQRLHAELVERNRMLQEWSKERREKEELEAALRQQIQELKQQIQAFGQPQSSTIATTTSSTQTGSSRRHSVRGSYYQPRNRQNLQNLQQ